MPTIKELREQQARLATEARAEFDKITDKTPEGEAAEIEARFDTMMSEHTKIGERIERMQRLEAAEAALRQGDPRRPLGQNTDAAGDQGGDGKPTYRQAFHAFLRSAGQLGEISQEERELLRGGFQRIEGRAQTAGTNSEGGYTVPNEMMAGLVKAMAAYGPMYDQDVCRVMTTTSGALLPIPTVDDTSKTGVAGTEGTTLTDDGSADAVFGQADLGAFSYNTKWLRVSRELVSDSMLDVEATLGDLLGERLGRLANSYLTTGTGTGQPLGIVTAATLGKTTASATAIAADEVIDFYHSIDPAYRASPKFRTMFHDTTLLALRKLKDADGLYLVQDLNDGTGRLRIGSVVTPYSVNQAMDQIATGKKPMVAGDFGRYFVRKVGAPLIGAIQDKDFWPGFGIAGWIRFDGKIADTRAIKYMANA